jgi:hypothetical protein
MHEELLLGTAVAPSYMYLFPLGTKLFIGTTLRVGPYKSSYIPTFFVRMLAKEGELNARYRFPKRKTHRTVGNLPSQYQGV